MKKKILIIISILLIIEIVIGAFYINKYGDFIAIYKFNKQIDVSGVKLLMTKAEAERAIGEPGSIDPFMSNVKSYKYSNANINLAFSLRGQFKEKVSGMTINNPLYSILGIHIDDKFGDAAVLLIKSGFQKASSGNDFRKGPIYVILRTKSDYPSDNDKIREIFIWTFDKTLEGIS